MLLSLVQGILFCCFLTFGELLCTQAVAANSPQNLQKPPPAKAKEKTTKIRILALGDSLTEGFGVRKEASYPAVLQKYLNERGHNVEVVNAGSSGSTSAGALSRMRWHLKSKDRFDVVILALGANDGLRGMDTKSTYKNLASAIELAQSQDLKIVLAGMQMPPNYGQQYTKDFAEIFPTLAKKYKVALIPFLLEGVAGDPKLNLPDGIHPNEQGYQKVVEHVSNSLKDVLN